MHSPDIKHDMYQYCRVFILTLNNNVVFLGNKNILGYTMPDRDQNSLPKQLKAWLKLCGLEPGAEMSAQINSILIAQHKSPLKELLGILAPSQQRILSEKDFDKISNPIISEYAKISLREYYGTLSREYLALYIFTSVLNSIVDGTLLPLVRSKVFSNTNISVESIINSIPAVRDGSYKIAHESLLSGRLYRPKSLQKRNLSDMDIQVL